MMRTKLSWVLVMLPLAILAGGGTAGADVIHFKNGISMWVEEAEEQGDEVVATRGGRQERFSMADVLRIEKKRTNMPSYRVEVPPPPTPPPAAGPGAPGAPGGPPGPGSAPSVSMEPGAPGAPAGPGAGPPGFAAPSGPGGPGGPGGPPGGPGYGPPAPGGRQG